MTEEETAERGTTIRASMNVQVLTTGKVRAYLLPSHVTVGTISLPTQDCLQWFANCALELGKACTAQTRSVSASTRGNDCHLVALHPYLPRYVIMSRGMYAARVGPQ